MTMRMFGVRGEITGRCTFVEEHHFVLDVDGEPFDADVYFESFDAKVVQTGVVLFVAGRIDLRNFDQGRISVFANRVERLEDVDPPDDEDESKDVDAVVESG